MNWRIESHLKRVTREQQALLRAHLEQVLSFGKTINLISKGTISEADFVHSLDSVLAIQTGQLVDSHGVCADVGSGAGFPGIPMAILSPACTVFLFEVDERKAEFLKTCVFRLGIENVRVKGEFPGREGLFDVVLSRGVGSGEDLGELSWAATSPGGRLVLLKSESWPEEDPPKSSTWNFLSAHAYSIPERGNRIILEYSKK